MNDSRILELGEESLQIMKNLFDSINDWTPLEEYEGTKFYLKKIEKNNVHEAGTIYMGISDFNCSLKEIVHIGTDPSLRKVWDVHNENYDELRQIGPNTYIYYISLMGKGPVKSRDFVTVRRICNENPDIFYDTHVSIPDFKEHVPQSNSDHIRAKLLPSGAKVVATSENTCRVQYICGAVIGGWIPTSVSNWVISSNNKDFFVEIKKYIKNKNSE